MDFIRHFVDTSASFLSWLTLRNINHSDSKRYDYGYGKLENMISLIVSIALFITVIIISFNAIKNIINPEKLEGATFGISLILGSLIFNLWIWLRNYKIAKKERSPIMESQWRLYMTKTFANVIIALPLGIGTLLPSYPWTMYLDPISSLILSVFILYTAYKLVSEAIRDLLDVTLDDTKKELILSAIANNHNHYKHFIDLRCRRSGKDIFADIFLEFPRHLRMQDVQQSIDTMKNDIEQSLENCIVTISPQKQQTIPNITHLKSTTELSKTRA